MLAGKGFQVTVILLLLNGFLFHLLLLHVSGITDLLLSAPFVVQNAQLLLMFLFLHTVYFAYFRISEAAAGSLIQKCNQYLLSWYQDPFL